MTPIPVFHTLSFHLCDLSLSKPIGVVRVNTWTRMLTSAVKTLFMKLWDSPGTTSIWSFVEEHMKAERLTKAPENAGKVPSTMKMKTWVPGTNSRK